MESLNPPNPTNIVLKTAVECLPPEILRIIASKYRRAYEIKPCLCPEAITMEPIETQLYKSFIRIIDKVVIYLFPDELFYNVCTGRNSSTLINVGNERLEYLGEHNPTFMKSPVLTMIWKEEMEYLECYTHSGLNIQTLMTALILLKRHNIPITGNTGIYLCLQKDNQGFFSSVRKLLYETPFLLNGTLNPIQQVVKKDIQKKTTNYCSMM
jgi:hypothetical protein